MQPPRYIYLQLTLVRGWIILPVRVVRGYWGQGERGFQESKPSIRAPNEHDPPLREPEWGRGTAFQEGIPDPARKPHRCDVGSYLGKYNTRFSIAAHVE